MVLIVRARGSEVWVGGAAGVELCALPGDFRASSRSNVEEGDGGKHEECRGKRDDRKWKEREGVRHRGPGY